MPRIQNSIIIRERPEKVFRITNDIERWPELFNEYQAAKVLTLEEAGRFSKVLFQLANTQGSWRSSRVIDHQDLVVIAEREEPLFPFAYMHLKWSYKEVPEGTHMTWTQDFELDSKFPDSLPVVMDRMNAHTRENQQRIKELIESGKVS